jgi:hypothetical protein
LIIERKLERFFFPMTTLRRYDGTSTTYSDAAMELLLAHLLSANSAGCSDGSVFFWTASPFLLLADLAFQVKSQTVGAL